MVCGIKKKFLSEVIGTFLLVFFGTGSVVMALIISNDINKNNFGIGILSGFSEWISIGLVFGLTTLSCIYLFGKISGSHLNPAVSIGLLVGKFIKIKEAIVYILAQIIGGILGSLALFLTLGTASIFIGALGATTPSLGVSYLQAILGEFIGTFFLVLVIMGVVVDKKAEPGFAGISIGFAITAIIAVLGPFTGASINPARTLGPYLIDFIIGNQNLWFYFPIYLIGPIFGAIVATVVYTYIAKDNEVCELPEPFKNGK